MLIETEQLREKLEDRFKKKLVSKDLIRLDDLHTFYEAMNYLYYLERIEQLFKEYFKGK